MLNIMLRVSVSQHETDVISKLKFGVDNIRFWQAANGNFEIWFTTSTDNICIFFNNNCIGVYNSKTASGFTLKP